MSLRDLILPPGSEPDPVTHTHPEPLGAGERPCMKPGCGGYKPHGEPAVAVHDGAPMVVAVERIEPCSLCKREALVYQSHGNTYRSCPECGHIELLGLQVQVKVGGGQ